LSRSLWWCFFFSSRRRHTRFSRDWSSDVCSSDLKGHRSLLALTCRRGPDRARPPPTTRPAAVPASTAHSTPGRRSTAYLLGPPQIGRASCRERVTHSVGAGAL